MIFCFSSHLTSSSSLQTINILLHNTLGTLLQNYQGFRGPQAMERNYQQSLNANATLGLAGHGHSVILEVSLSSHFLISSLKPWRTICTSFATTYRTFCPFFYLFLFETFPQTAVTVDSRSFVASVSVRQDFYPLKQVCLNLSENRKSYFLFVIVKSNDNFRKWP